MLASRFPSKPLLFAVFILFVAPSFSFGQITNVTDDQTTPTPGAGHNYIGSGGNETVNPANGSVSFRLDAGVPKGRGLTVPFIFAYDSNGAMHATPSNPTPQQASWTSNNGFGWGGWSFTVPFLTWSSRNVTDPHNPNNVCNYVTDFVFQDPTGGRHFLGMLGWLTTSTDCGGLAVPAPTLSGGADIYTAVATSPAAALVMVTDITTGTAYSFNTSGAPPYTSIGASFVEDRNGNKVTFSPPYYPPSPGSLTVTDTLGRQLTVSTTYGPVQVPGLTNPYSLGWTTWQTGSHVVNQSPDSNNPPYCPSNPILGYAFNFPVVTSLTLPNNQQYTFLYDSSSGLLKQITYPSGGWVKYTWSLNRYADHIYVADNFGDKGVHCGYTYDAYAVTERQVSFDGSSVALDQTFSYTTNWSTYNGYKTTTVTSTDKTRTPNVVTKTIYTYNAAGTPNGPYDPFAGPYVVPVEGSVAYQDNSGNTLRTTNKSWNDQSMMTCESINQNGSISRTDYWPGALYTWANKKEWDSPVCGTDPQGTPLRETDYVMTGISVQIYPSNYWPNSTDPVFGRPTSVTVNYGGTQAAQTTYVYDGASLVSSGTTVGRDTNYNGTSITTRGNATSKTQHCLYNCSADALTAYTYDDTGQMLSMTDPNQNPPTQYSYTDNFPACGTAPGSTNAYLAQITDAKGFTQTFTYRYCDGQLASSTDRNGNTTSYSYADSLSRLTSITYPPGGGQTTYGYTSICAPPSSTTMQIDGSLNYTESATLDGLCHVTRKAVTSDPEGTDYTDTAYDGFGRPWKVWNPYRSTSDTSYGFTTSSYDAIGRTADVGTNHAILYPDGSYTSTTYSGWSSTVIDPAGKTRTLTSDSMGRLSLVKEDPSTLNYQTNYTYGAFDNLLTVTQGAQTRTFTYDSFPRLHTAQNPEVGIGSTQCLTTYGYDPNGNMTSRIAPLPNQNSSCNNTVTTTNAYDALNRLTSKSYNDNPQTPTANFFYDVAPGTMPAWSGVSFSNANGRLVFACTGSAAGSCTSPQTATAQSYDPMGRVQDHWQCTIANCSLSSIWHTNYLHKYTGEVYQWTHPGGFTLTNTISQARRITEVQSSLTSPTLPGILAQNVTYTAWGALKTLQNGYAGSGVNVQETYMYNKRLQPGVVQLGTTSNHTADYCLVYDYYGSLPTSCPTSPPTGTTGNNGNVRGYWYQDSALSTASHKRSYSYDSLNRLGTAVATDFSNNTLWSQTYTYDRWGNMSCSGSGLCTSMSYNASNNNQLISVGLASVTYDAAGNLTQDTSSVPSRSYQWDAEGHIRSIDGGTTASMTFNALGWRVYRTNGARSYWVDLQGRLLGGSWAQWNAAVPFGGRTLAEYASGSNETLYFDHPNALGSEEQWTNWAGSYAGEVQFYPWGAKWGDTTNGNLYQYYASLQLYDPEVDGYQPPNRYEIPRLGRWLTPDPIGKQAVKLDDPQTWNMYAYVRNSPTTLTDPSGQCDWCQRLVNWGSGDGFVSDAELASSQQRIVVTPLMKPRMTQAARTALMAVTRPSGRRENVYQIGGIVNAETRGMKDSASENVPLSTAREEIAEVRINGDQKWGDEVGSYAGMAPPIYGGPDFQASLDAAANAAWSNLNGVSLTGGATNYRMWTSMDEAGPAWGMPVYTTAGPYLSPTSNTVISTYGPNIE